MVNDPTATKVFIFFLSYLQIQNDDSRAEPTKAGSDAQCSTGIDERLLDKEDLDSGEEIVRNPWNGKAVIRGWRADH